MIVVPQQMTKFISFAVRHVWSSELKGSHGVIISNPENFHTGDAVDFSYTLVTDTFGSLQTWKPCKAHHRQPKLDPTDAPPVHGCIPLLGKDPCLWTHPLLMDGPLVHGQTPRPQAGPLSTDAPLVHVVLRALLECWFVHSTAECCVPYGATGSCRLSVNAHPTFLCL